LRPTLTHSTVVAYLALFVALGGGAYAATSLVGSDGKIRGCVSGHGKLTVLKRGKQCKGGQTAIAWNQRGPSGEDGGAGPKGDTGVKGDPGPAATNAAHAVTADSAANADSLDNKDSSTFAPVGSEGWHLASLNDGLEGTNGTVAGCHYSPYGGGFSSPSYFRDPAGMVHIRGLTQAQDGIFPCASVPDPRIFTLPLGYRPETDAALTTISNNKAGRINVRSGGKVELEPNFPTFADAKNWVSLDGLTFRCAPAGQNGCP
jgi:hypothetical protein